MFSWDDQIVLDRGDRLFAGLLSLTFQNIYLAGLHFLFYISLPGQALPYTYYFVGILRRMFLGTKLPLCGRRGLTANEYTQPGELAGQHSTDYFAVGMGRTSL